MHAFSLLWQIVRRSDPLLRYAMEVGASAILFAVSKLVQKKAALKTLMLVAEELGDNAMYAQLLSTFALSLARWIKAENNYFIVSFKGIDV